MAILGIGACGFPLWAHHPLPRESLAFPELLCGQILILSMLFPILTQIGWLLAINLALMVPFDELAGLLSNTPQTIIAKCGCSVGLWMVGLAGWRMALKDYRSYLFVIMVALLFTAGGAVADYLRWEATAAAGINHFSAISFLPNLCDFGNSNPLFIWPETAFPVVAVGGFAMGAKFLSKATKIPSTSLHPDE